MSTPGLVGVGLLGGADDDPGAVDLFDDAGAAGDHGGAGVAGDHVLHAGADQRRVRLDQRHGLTLHVRAHQGAVGVVVFQEGDQGRGHRHHLLGRDVHEVDLILGRQGHVAVDAHGRPDRRAARPWARAIVGLGDDVLGLLHGRHVDHLLGGLAVRRPGGRGSR